MASSKEPYGQGSRYAIASAVKTLDVLLAFRDMRGPASLTKLTMNVRLHRNQVYRSLKSLEAVGLVQETPEGFELTAKILELVPAVQRKPVAAVAEPFLLALRQSTGETVNLVQWLGGRETICIATYPSPHAIGLRTRVGQRSGLHAGAVPKAVLAFLPPHERDGVLSALRQLPRYTDRTILDAKRLGEELSEIVACGYATSDEDFEPGARGVGAPIFDPEGVPLGGISVGGPKSRFGVQECRHYGALVVRTASQISGQLGYVPVSGAIADTQRSV